MQPRRPYLIGIKTEPRLPEECYAFAVSKSNVFADLPSPSQNFAIIVLLAFVSVYNTNLCSRLWDSYVVLLNL